MITLRPYQSTAVDNIREAMRAGARSVLYQGSTGSGKTVIFSYLAESVFARGKRVLILAHRDELLDQISDTLREFNVEHGFVAASRNFHSAYRVHVASVQTLVRRLHYLPQPDLIIQDEAHHCTRTSQWGKVFDHFKDVLRIGVTATPCRLSGEALGDLFDTLILGPSVTDLIEQGALSPYRIFAPALAPLTGINRSMGDYAKGELSDFMDRPSITGDALATYKQHADGKQACVFCVSVKHAQHVAESFQAAGYPAISLDGSLERFERKRRVGDFRRSIIKILTSCEIVNEGFDVPGIECGIFLRPTQSLTLWLQQVGRCMRPAEGKTAILLDHANNSMRHGLPDTEREWTLNGSNNGRAKNSAKQPVRRCMRCYAVMGLAAIKCKWCGFVFPIKAREVETVEGELKELSPEERRHRALRIEQGRATTYEALLKIEQIRGYKPGWARHVWNAKQHKRLARSGTVYPSHVRNETLSTLAFRPKK